MDLTTDEMFLTLLEKNADPNKVVVYEAHKNIIFTGSGTINVVDPHFEDYVCKINSSWRAKEGDRVYLKFSKKKRTIVEG